MNTKWKSNGRVIAEGNQSNHLYCPQGIYINDDHTIFIADYGNHRIVQWQLDQQLISLGYGRGNQVNQLNYPTNVFRDKNDQSLWICDYGNRRLLRWPCSDQEMSKVILSNIHCFDLLIDNHGDLFVSDTNKHQVQRWRKGESQETIVASGNGQGDGLNQLNSPSYIFIDRDESLYISDCNNNRVMRWCKGATEGSIIIGGDQLNLLRDISFDRQGNLYIVDYSSNRIQKFSINFN